MKKWIEDRLLTLLLYLLAGPVLLFLACCLIYDRHAEWRLKRSYNAKPKLKD
ncbi:hypothetical protein [Ferribacterium limneticum]|uniref:hypothetical protein n=1 Tax=Ferribacterium limneticum TaxID=76259 RepID=UPI001CF866C5|nr:hypothetical protein [Ferribacterium limneticum]UCV26704.1 hypothetical protein KI617_10325 [Ferribacterium limneticum]UCV30621.1 hypothetical protein KI608_10325 [Ferribacterium limneticum]